MRLVVHDREEFDRYYNVFANPTLWFIHHYLWGLAPEPSVDRNVRLAWDAGYVPVNQGFADAVVAELKRAEGPAVVIVARLPAVHGARARFASACRDASSSTSPTSRGRSRTTGGCCPPDIRTPSTVAPGLRRRRPAHGRATSALPELRGGVHRRPGRHGGAHRPPTTAASCASATTRSRSTRPSSTGCARARRCWPKRGAAGVAAGADHPARRPHRSLEEHRARAAGVRALPVRAPGMERTGDASGLARPVPPGHSRVRRVPGRDPARRPLPSMTASTPRRLAAGRAAHL